MPKLNGKKMLTFPVEIHLVSFSYRIPGASSTKEARIMKFRLRPSTKLRSLQEVPATSMPVAAQTRGREQLELSSCLTAKPRSAKSTGIVRGETLPMILAKPNRTASIGFKLERGTVSQERLELLTLRLERRASWDHWFWSLGWKSAYMPLIECILFSVFLIS